MKRRPTGRRNGPRLYHYFGRDCTPAGAVDRAARPVPMRAGLMANAARLAPHGVTYCALAGVVRRYFGVMLPVGAPSILLPST